ncbi:MAG: sulfotransferase [Bacteroidetes bacterium]|nr:sulfotransferase [Bacteroidota bacterium]
MNKTQMIRRVVLPVQKSLMGFDKRIIKAPMPGNPVPPIFVIGAPRSGSTLFFQYLLKTFHLAYISNLSALMPKYNHFTLRTQRALGKLNWNQVARSSYGYIPGLFGPNEAGKYCDFLFDDQGKEHTENVRKTIAYYEKIFAAPLLIKNLNNSLILPEINRVFPNARIVFFQRETSFNAQSILDARMQNLGTRDEWFSVRPEGYKDVLDKDIFFQTVWQVNKIREIIQKDLQRLNMSSITLRYEDFIANPNDVLRKFRDFTGQPEKAEFNYAELQHKNSVKLSASEWELIEHYCVVYPKES